MSLVQEGSNLRKGIYALDLMSIPARKQRTWRLYRGLAAKGAAVGNGAFAASLTAVATAAAPDSSHHINWICNWRTWTTIAAPFIAITALIVSFTQLFTAMLKAPEAIMAA